MVLVEDDPDLAVSLAELLTPLCQLFLTASAGEALARLAGERVDVVVSDWDLGPGMSGAALLAEVATRWPRVKRVLMSGNAALSDVEHAHEALRKPFAPNVLCDLLFPSRQ